MVRPVAGGDGLKNGVAPSFDFADCDLSEWMGLDTHCRWCDEELPLHRLPRGSSPSLFCSPSCTLEWRQNHVWEFAKSEAKRRAKRQCSDEACTSRLFLHVHHVEPCAGNRTMSCLHHQGNLEVLCEGHHEEEHGRLREAVLK